MTSIASFGIIAFASGCSSTPSLVGEWEMNGGGTKVFYEDGTCENMLSVDIGGPMYCTISEKETDGYFSLRVKQGENSASLLVKPDGKDRLAIYNKSGQLLYELDRT
uniref:hypothetical protein n=1 Tax=Rhodococcus erythropolis TaxID=1833 RepID=UPI00117ACFBC|nr:hypothetical protein [Rhodococcus erythropolis]